MKLRHCDVDEFAIRTKDKKIICFGAMNMPVNFVKAYPKYHFENRIKYLSDNDPKKWGNMLLLDNGVEREVISPEKLRTVVDGNTIIFITSMYFAAIIKQLDGYHELDNTECYIYPFMQYDRRFDEKIPLRHMDEPLIPKKIHYFWFGRGPKPELAMKCIDSWKKFCPDWEIIEWNEDNYDVNKHRFMKEAYKENLWACVSDYARLDVIFHEGGFYFDTDVEIIKNIDELTYNEGFFGFGNWGRVASGLGIGGVAKQSLFGKLLDAYGSFSVYNQDGVLDPEITNTIREERVYLDEGLKPNDKYQIVDGCAILPSDTMSPLVPGFFEPRITINTLSIHHNKFSWGNPKEQKEIKESKDSEIEIRRRFVDD